MNLAKIISILLALFLLLNSLYPQEEKSMSFYLVSLSFEKDGSIPVKYTCHRENISPALIWEGAPPETKSFALIVDAPGSSGILNHSEIGALKDVKLYLPKVKSISEFVELLKKNRCKPRVSDELFAGAGNSLIT